MFPPGSLGKSTYSCFLDTRLILVELALFPLVDYSLVKLWQTYWPSRPFSMCGLICPVRRLLFDLLHDGS
jgi:hypothetical protein